MKYKKIAIRILAAVLAVIMIGSVVLTTAFGAKETSVVKIQVENLSLSEYIIIDLTNNDTGKTIQVKVNRSDKYTNVEIENGSYQISGVTSNNDAIIASTERDLLVVTGNSTQTISIKEDDVRDSIPEENFWIKLLKNNMVFLIILASLCIAYSIIQHKKNKELIQDEKDKQR